MPRIRLQLLARGAVLFLIGVLLDLLNTGVLVILCVWGVLYIVMMPFVRLLRWPLLPLVALGSMPLSAYTLHVLAIFVAAGPFGRVTSSGVFGTGLILALTALATLWWIIRGRGPFETLLARAARRAQN